MNPLFSITFPYVPEPYIDVAGTPPDLPTIKLFVCQDWLSEAGISSYLEGKTDGFINPDSDCVWSNYNKVYLAQATWQQYLIQRRQLRLDFPDVKNNPFEKRRTSRTYYLPMYLQPTKDVMIGCNIIIEPVEKVSWIRRIWERIIF